MWKRCCEGKHHSGAVGQSYFLSCRFGAAGIANVAATKLAAFSAHIAQKSMVVLGRGPSWCSRPKVSVTNNITLPDEADDSVKLKVICTIDDSLNDGRNRTQWRDVTPQNTILAPKLEMWLYEQIEEEIKKT